MEGISRRQVEGDRLIIRVADWRADLSIAALALLLVLAWIVSYEMGGSRSVGPQLFHIPTVIAAARFGARGAAIVAVAGGIACGPLLPLDVASGEEQSAGNWGSRLVMLVVVGQVVALLQSRSLGTTRRRLDDHRFRASLEHAVAAGEITPHYQPIVSLADGRIVGVEALARWEQDGRVVPPAQFIAGAERCGVIGLVDDAVMRAAGAQLMAWRRAGTVNEDFSVAVNLSALDLDDSALVDRVGAVLAECGCPPGAITLEVTETAVADDPVTAAGRLTELKALGVGIALDDFGTGNSSLASLGRLPIDAYKIDKSFTDQLVGTRHGRGLMASVVHLAEALALGPPVIEGVETADQLAILAEIGGRRAQGYVFARPQPAAELEQLLLDGCVDVRP